MDVGDKITFDYTGNIQEYTFTQSGFYQIEVYGGEGGRGAWYWGQQYASGGKGGYATGYKKFKKGDKIYIGIGAKGGDHSGNAGQEYFFYTYSGGYNGGGNGYSYGTGESAEYYGNAAGSGSGGGATHIATTNRGTLSNYSSYQSEVLIVAGGGGGGFAGEGRGGSGKSGGGAGGNNASGSFGQGSSRGNNVDSWNYDDIAIGGGGGGGWNGGGASNRSGGGGGSSYIDNLPSITIGGTTYSSSKTAGQRSGNGQAILTLIKKMSAYLGDTEVDALYIGDNAVDNIYLGDNEA